jgi:hypothetical protein
LPLLLIALLKSRRRKSRFSEGHPAQRVGGGWSEVVSLATDMGAAVDSRATRRESAAVLAEAFPAAGGTTTLLARRADASIFGAGQPSEEEVREYWTIVDSSLQEMTSTAGFWRRQQARFSPRSLLADARNALALRGPLALPSLKALNPASRRRTGSAATGQGGTAPERNEPQGPAAEGTPEQDRTTPEPPRQGPAAP